jgi:hypothetical protein
MVTPYYIPSLTTAQNGITNIPNNLNLTTTLAGQQKVIYGQPVNGVYGAGLSGTPAVGGLSYSGSSMAGSGVARANG